MIYTLCSHWKGIFHVLMFVLLYIIISHICVHDICLCVQACHGAHVGRSRRGFQEWGLSCCGFWDPNSRSRVCIARVFRAILQAEKVVPTVVHPLRYLFPTPESCVEVFWSIKFQVWKNKTHFHSWCRGLQREAAICELLGSLSCTVSSGPARAMQMNKSKTFINAHWELLFLFSFSLWYKWTKTTSVYNTILSSPRKC